MVPVPSVPMIVIVITDMVITVMVVIAPMILVMIVVFRIALLLVLVMVIITFASESRCGKHESTCYRANEGEFANHLVFLCY